MRIRLIPVLNDNYTYLLIDDATKTAAIVDPAEAGPVLAAVAEEGVRLTHVLATHYHWDHIGGVDALIEAIDGLQVVGGAVEADRIAQITQSMEDGEIVEVGDLRGKTLLVPCHTRGHVAFLFGDALFCGDMLFVGGCGRFFEGTAEEMHHALNEVFARLPDDTRVFCGHEYTVSNLRFAVSVEPENADLQEKLAWAEQQRATGQPTIPSTIGGEKGYNPFMRVHVPAIAQAVGGDTPAEVMGRLREKKNQFRG